MQDIFPRYRDNWGRTQYIVIVNKSSKHFVYTITDN